MEYRLLGNSGLKVPVLSFGTATFGGGNDFFRAWGSTQVEEATRLVDMALEAGVNLFDTADVYSHGMAEEILGKAIGKRRDQLLIATKANARMEPGPNGLGSSRFHLIRACEAAGRIPVAHGTITGNSLKVEMSVRTAKTADVSDQWLAEALNPTSGQPSFTPSGFGD